MPSSEAFVPNSVWSSSPIAGLEEQITLPSGQTVMAKKMSVQAVIETGMLGEVDFLTQTVDQYTRKIKGGKGVADGTPVISDKILENTDAVAQIVNLTDILIPHIVTTPRVHLHYITTVVGKTKVNKMIKPADREIGEVYTDQISLEDKMFLFNWSTEGLAGFASFRGEADGNVGDLGAVPGPPRKTKRRNRNR